MPLIDEFRDMANLKGKITNWALNIEDICKYLLSACSM
jgi:hypothetical protein